MIRSKPSGAGNEKSVNWTSKMAPSSTGGWEGGTVFTGAFGGGGGGIRPTVEDWIDCSFDAENGTLQGLAVEEEVQLHVVVAHSLRRQSHWCY